MLEARRLVCGWLPQINHQLEVKGGQGADVSSVDFGGTWELLYTNAVDLIAVLSVSKLPLPIKIGAITQTINTSNDTVENSVQLEVRQSATVYMDTDGLDRIHSIQLASKPCPFYNRTIRTRIRAVRYLRHPDVIR